MRKLRVNIIFIIIFFFLNLYSNSIANISSNFIDDITNRASNILSSEDARVQAICNATWTDEVKTAFQEMRDAQTDLGD